MALRFEEITFDNYHECISLEVKPEQKDNFYFKSAKPNVISLAEAYVFKNNSQVLAIYDDDIMVGAMFYNGEAEANGEFWLIRFMIDQRYQGQGFGRKSLEMLIERVRKDGGKKLSLSYEPHNKHAEKLYLSLGFRPTGETHGEQIVVKLDLDIK